MSANAPTPNQRSGLEELAAAAGGSGAGGVAGGKLVSVVSNGCPVAGPNEVCGGAKYVDGSNAGLYPPGVLGPLPVFGPGVAGVYVGGELAGVPAGGGCTATVDGICSTGTGTGVGGVICAAVNRVVVDGPACTIGAPVAFVGTIIAELTGAVDTSGALPVGNKRPSPAGERLTGLRFRIVPRRTGGGGR